MLTLRCFFFFASFHLSILWLYIAFPEECWGRRMFAALLKRHFRSWQGEDTERQTSLFLPLSSIRDNPLCTVTHCHQHCHHDLPTPSLPSSECFSLVFWTEDWNFFFPQSTRFVKVDSWPQPPPLMFLLSCKIFLTKLGISLDGDHWRLVGELRLTDLFPNICTSFQFLPSILQKLAELSLEFRTKKCARKFPSK